MINNGGDHLPHSWSEQRCDDVMSPTGVLTNQRPVLRNVWANQRPVFTYMGSGAGSGSGSGVGGGVGSLGGGGVAGLGGRG